MSSNQASRPLASLGPYILTVVLTLVFATLFQLVLDNWNVFEQRRLEANAPIFHDKDHPPPSGLGTPPAPPANNQPPQAPGAPPGDPSSDRVPVVDPTPPEDPEFTPINTDEAINVRVYEAVNRAVVNISTSATVRGLFRDSEVSGSGSGFVISEQGYILTNHHVVEGAELVQVGFFDGAVLDARVVGTDPSNDVAVLQVDSPPERLFPVVLGESRNLKVGQKVLALGNPFGLERTLTSGIISSLDRSLEAKNGRMIRGVIQTDASINPGNSGGPLLNARGEVIGMTTAIYSNVGQSAGIGFAVPISMIKRVLRPLIEQGYVERATLGITRVYALDEGLLVLGVERGGPADRAGIRPLRIRYLRDGPFIRAEIDPTSADLIVAVEGTRVRTVGELLTEVESHPPGSIISLTVRRDGGIEEIPVRLGRMIVR